MARSTSSSCNFSIFYNAFLPLCLTILALPYALGVLVNTTVDDWYRDPTDNTSWVIYTPYTSWPLSQGAACDSCTAHPDPSRAYFGTWHENVNDGVGTSADNMFADFRFTGVAVYVYCIVPRSFSAPDGNADMRFFIDGDEVGSYVRAPNGTDAYEYNVPVYVNTSLPAGTHSIMLLNGQSGTQESVVLLDYIVYTRDSSEAIPSFLPSATSVTNSNSNSLASPESMTLPIVIGVIVGGIVVTALVGASMTLYKRWKRRRLPPSAQYIQSVSRIEGGGVSDAADSQGREAGWVQGTAPATIAAAPENGVEVDASGGTGILDETEPIAAAGQSSPSRPKVRFVAPDEQPEAGPSRLPRPHSAETLPEFGIEEVSR